MRVFVRPLFENGGRPVPNWRETLAPMHEGELIIASEFLRAFKRHTIVARLRPSGCEADVLPMLIDASLGEMKGDIMKIRGLHWDEMSRSLTAQAWFVQFGASTPAAAGG
jgi:hypothetical protein